MVPPASQATFHSPEELARAVRDAGGAGRDLLLALSSMTFGTSPLLVRAGVFARGAQALEPLVVGLIRAEDRAAAARALGALGDVAVGGWDAGYATGWSRAWASGAGTWHLWSPSGRTAWVSDRTLHAGGEALAWDDVDHVTVWSSPDRVVRRVVVHRFDGEPLVLLEEQDEIAGMDPAYDFVCLDTDTAWMQDLARSLGEALAKPCFVELK